MVLWEGSPIRVTQKAALGKYVREKPVAGMVSWRELLGWFCVAWKAPRGRGELRVLLGESAREVARLRLRK